MNINKVKGLHMATNIGKFVFYLTYSHYSQCLTIINQWLTKQFIIIVL